MRRLSLIEREGHLQRELLEVLQEGLLVVEHLAWGFQFSSVLLSYSVLLLYRGLYGGIREHIL
jgi:hypothetical protein